MHNLGSIYASGYGVVMDKIEAYKWFELSSQRTIGLEHANSLEARYWTEGYLTPRQVSRSQVQGVCVVAGASVVGLISRKIYSPVVERMRSTAP